MASDNLNLSQLTGTENEKTNLINEIFQQLEDALTEQLSVAIVGATKVLTSDQCYRYMVYEFTGTPAGDQDVEVLTGKKLYLCENAVTDGSVLTVKTNAGTGIDLAQGVKKILYCDGTDVIEIGPGAQLMQTLCFGVDALAPLGDLAYFRAAGWVQTSGTVGYEMTRPGSIVGLGVNLELISEVSPGSIDVEVMKNGATVYAVTIATAGVGVYTQSGVQGVGIDTFVKGDSLALRVKYNDAIGRTWDHGLAHVEVAVSL